MLTNDETWCLHNNIIVKSIKCNEVISLLKSHSDLSELIAPHFGSNGSNEDLDIIGEVKGSIFNSCNLCTCLSG
jgi:hypothetical protein